MLRIISRLRACLVRGDDSKSEKNKRKKSDVKVDRPYRTLWEVFSSQTVRKRHLKESLVLDVRKRLGDGVGEGENIVGNKRWREGEGGGVCQQVRQKPFPPLAVCSSQSRPSNNNKSPLKSNGVEPVCQKLGGVYNRYTSE